MENTNTFTLHENALFHRLLSNVIQFFQSCLPIIPTVENVSTSTPNDNGNTSYPPEENGNTPYPPEENGNTSYPPEENGNTPYPPEENGNTSCRDYDVFINHRGPDVKATFATYLYCRLRDCGLKVFLDKPEMQVGDDSTGQIKQAIETASIQIAVFSPTYAESTWCLKELAHMFERYKSGQAIIIPVFYEVDPSQLRWTGQGKAPTGNYGKALNEMKMKSQLEENIIEKWRETLKSVADLSGLESKDFKG